jgi:hypothetical protein
MAGWQGVLHPADIPQVGEMWWEASLPAVRTAQHDVARTGPNLRRTGSISKPVWSKFRSWLKVRPLFTELAKPPARWNVRFFEKREGSGTEIPIPALAYLPDAPSACRPARLWRVIFGLRNHGRLEQSTKCILIALAMSLVPQRQPQSIRRLGGRPRLAFEFFPRRSELFT